MVIEAWQPEHEMARKARKKDYHHGDLRDSLLRAAEAELSEKGVEGFTLRGCAKRAGVSHAAPAHHFRDAQALLTALAATGFDRLRASMAARSEKAGTDARARLAGCGLGYVDFALSNVALFKLMFGSDKPADGNPDLQANSAAAFNMLVQGVAAVRGADPMVSPEGSRDVAAAWAIVHGLAHLMIEGKMKFFAPASAKERDASIAQIISRVMP